MDDKARKILLNTYWSTLGWRDEPCVTSQDLEYAKSQRAMFDPVRLTHEDAIVRACAMAGRVTQRQVADAFLASLSTRRLEWRSALGSFSVLRWMPAHAYVASENRCGICGLFAGEHEYDLSAFNFSRLKWGGVDHSNPVYAGLDLMLFREDLSFEPTHDDIRIFRDLVAMFDSVPASVTSAQLHKYFPSSLKANKTERDQVIAILGLCGVLETRENAGFGEQFVPYQQRATPNRHFADMAYPASWWTASDGLNAKRLQEIFGHVL